MNEWESLNVIAAVTLQMWFIGFCKLRSKMNLAALAFKEFFSFVCENMWYQLIKKKKEKGKPQQKTLYCILPLAVNGYQLYKQ